MENRVGHPACEKRAKAAEGDNFVSNDSDCEPQRRIGSEGCQGGPGLPERTDRTGLHRQFGTGHRRPPVAGRGNCVRQWQELRPLLNWR